MFQTAVYIWWCTVMLHVTGRVNLGASENVKHRYWKKHFTDCDLWREKTIYESSIFKIAKPNRICKMSEQFLIPEPSFIITMLTVGVWYGVSLFHYFNGTTILQTIFYTKSWPSGWGDWLRISSVRGLWIVSIFLIR